MKTAKSARQRNWKAESNTMIGVSPITRYVIVNRQPLGSNSPMIFQFSTLTLGREKWGELPYNISLCPFARVPGKKACTSNGGRSKLSVFARHVHSMHFLNVPRVLCDRCGADYARGDEIARHICSGTAGTSNKGRPPNSPKKKRKMD